MSIPLKMPLSEEDKARYCKRLTKSQWATAKAKWETGEFTLDMLSKEFDISKHTLSRRFIKDGIIKGAKKVEKEVREKIAAATATDAVEAIKRIKDTKNQGYLWAQGIGAQIFNTIAKASKAGEKYSTVEKEIRTLKMAMEGLRLSRQERWEVLGLNIDNELEEELPEFTVRDLSEEEIEELRGQQPVGEFDDTSSNDDYNPEDIEDLPDEESDQDP